MARINSAGRAANRNAWLAFQIGMGLALVAFGLVAANQRRANARRRRPLRDYSGRSGLPRGVEASRGIASDAPIPADMLTPEPLRPFTSGSPR
jgi:hypothetical protein